MHKGRLFFLIFTVVVLIITCWIFLFLWLGRSPLPLSTVSTTALSQIDKLNINTATAKQLADLPGIGEKLSEAIVAHRSQNGEFKNIGELIDVPGIGSGKLEAIADLITVGG